MSRRKQSNPKPIKRQSEEDADELSKMVHLPQDILTLKENTNLPSGFSVCTVIPLPKGSSFGPFKITQVEGEATDENTLKIPEPEGKETPILIETESGHWLRLINIVSEETKESQEVNSTINIQGDQIWCEITTDISQDTELVAMVMREVTGPEEDAVDGNDVSVAMETIKDTAAIVPDSEPPQGVSHALIFGCPNCGVRFSSPRTLEAHITYYCSKRPELLSVETSSGESMNQTSHIPAARKRVASSDSRGEAPDDDSQPSDVKRRRIPSESRSPMVSPGIKQQPTTPSPTLEMEPSSSIKRCSSTDPSGTEEKTKPSAKIYKCTQCAYSSDKKNSLHSHIRNMHKVVKDGTSENLSKIDDTMTSPETYCAECKIQFSSPKTFQGHKEFYCGKRQKPVITDDVEEGDVRSRSSSEGHSPRGNVLSPGVQPGPVLLPPGCLSSRGQPIPGSLSAQPTVVFTGPIMTTPGPTGIALTVPVIMQPLFVPNSLTVHPGLGPVSGIEDKPLDLSVKKNAKTEDTDRNSLSKSASPVQHIEDKPTDLSMKKSPPSSVESEAKSKDSTLVNYPVTSGLISVDMPAGTTGGLPHNLSICSECNIVFYKHENFLIHKQFYCSGRKPKHSKEGQSSPELGSRTVASDGVKTPESENTRDTSPGVTKSPSPKDPLLQFSCTPCKIKFSSLSTLEAHQRYYCPYRPQNPELSSPSLASPAAEDETSDEEPNPAMPHVCQKCGNEYPTARLLKVHLCQNSNVPGIWNLLRCSQCSFVTHKESQFNDHVRKHSSAKGFRCSLCGYRGNTIRGMRMHGKLHVDKGENFTDENMVVLDSDGSENKEDLSNPILNGDIESEIMRLKNEPYKRRRSRYKKHLEEGQTSREVPKTDPVFVCGMCNAPFTSCGDLGQHMQTHLETKPYKCPLCEYSSRSKSHLEKHMKVIHKTECYSSPESFKDKIVESNRLTETKSVNNDKITNIKQENDSGSSVTHVNSSSPKSEISDPSVFRKSELVKSLLRKIKQEPQNEVNENELRKSPPTVTNTSPTIEVKTEPTEKFPEKDTKELSDVSPKVVNGSGKTNFRYCNHCDISFMYLSSFVAHKKYYCNATITENIQAESEVGTE